VSSAAAETVVDFDDNIVRQRTFRSAIHEIVRAMSSVIREASMAGNIFIKFLQ
jgi:hypothetical protein